MAGVALIRTAYSLFGQAITPALRLWLNHRVGQGKEDPYRLGERFGQASATRPAGTLVWLHAASVGETQSVLTLVRALLAQHPTIHLLITTGTLTSAALVAQQSLPRVIHQFVPVDTHAAVQQFLQHWHPDLALWVESEFWPQLLWQTQKNHIPMLLVNARISAKTFTSWRRWPRTIRSLLAGFTSIYAGSSDDAQRLRLLGAKTIHDVGNLKYDAAPLPIDKKLCDAFATSCPNRPLFVAASTHANEEETIADVHAIAAQQFPDLLTIIIPRHARRGDSIAADLRARNLIVAQRSKSEAITPQTAIYLADTMGELGSFYALADVVFMGGSLIAHGGQNPLEAARMGKALLSGPHTHNFASIMAQFVAADAIAVIADKKALAATLIHLLTHADVRQQMGARAAATVAASGGASTIILQHCATLLPVEAA